MYKNLSENFWVSILSKRTTRTSLLKNLEIELDQNELDLGEERKCSRIAEGGNAAC